MGALLLLTSAAHSGDSDGAGEILFQQKLAALPGPILTEAEVAGRRCRMLVDTGAENAMLDLSLHDLVTGEFGQGVKDLTGKMIESKLGRISRLRAQSLVTENPLVLLFDGKPFSAQLGRSLDGFLGMEQLKAGRILLDYDHGMLVIHTGAWRLDGADCQEAELEDFRPLATYEASIENRRGEFIVDTGNDGTIDLDSSLFTALMRNGSIEVSPRQATTVIFGGTHKMRQGWFLKGELMGRSLAGTTVTSIEKDEGTSSLGTSWLCGFNIEIDFSAHRWRFQKRRAAPPPLSYDLMTGVKFLFPGGVAVVESLRPDGKGAAQKSGLRVGDVITQFDTLRGEHIDEIALREIVAARAGQRIPIRYRRPPDTMEIDTLLELSPAISDWNFAGRDIWK